MVVVVKKSKSKKLSDTQAQTIAECFIGIECFLNIIDDISPEDFKCDTFTDEVQQLIAKHRELWDVD
jgi:hypothetical protein